jgi:hypothetical protein
MTKFALMVSKDLPPDQAAARGVLQEAYEGLLALGHSAPEARQMIEKAGESGKKFKSVEDVLEELYRSHH